MRRVAPSGDSALQMSKESGWRMSLQLMAMLMAVSCLSPVMTHTCTDRCAHMRWCFQAFCTLTSINADVQKAAVHRKRIKQCTSTLQDTIHRACGACILHTNQHQQSESKQPQSSDVSALHCTDVWGACMHVVIAEPFLRRPTCIEARWDTEQFKQSTLQERHADNNSNA